MEKFIERFIEKNTEAYKELEKFLLRKDDIKYMVCSTELGMYITENDDDVITGGMWLWNERPLIPNPYMKSQRLDFILKDDTLHHMEFIVPCVCGIYPDEPHTFENHLKS